MTHKMASFRLLTISFGLLFALLVRTDGQENKMAEQEKQWASISEKVNRFGFELQRRLSATMGGDTNIVFSPFSMFSAFSAVCIGARGETQEQMMRSLEWGDSADFLEYMLSWYQTLADQDGGSGTQLHAANRMWASGVDALTDQYTEDVERYFDAKVKGISLANPDKTVASINKWVAKKTRNNIRELFPTGAINAMTRLVVVNVVYFKGKWAAAFEKGSTVEGSFCLSGSECLYDRIDYPYDRHRVKASYMTRHGEYNITYHSDATVLEVPYAGDRYSMLFLLPPPGSSLDALERNTSADFLNSIMAAATEQKNLFVQIPKFSVEQELNLDAHLLQMDDLFDSGKADLSGINGGHDLYVSKAVHKAKLTVDEEGTVAAAVTGSVIQSRSKPPEFVLNRPFLFCIIHKPTKAIIFSGKIMDPRS